MPEILYKNSELIKVDFARKKLISRQFFDQELQAMRKIQKVMPEKLKLVTMEANTAGYATHKAILIIPATGDPDDGYALEYSSKVSGYNSTDEVIEVLRNTIKKLGGEDGNKESS